ncbi:MAG: histidine phosphatase family protein [Actinobacteria bacterium]|nr:histidine phosphatase family protein [Actinomycetota bacterium]
MLYIVRHGRTESNASGLLLGHADPPLDELGRWQAAQAARSLSPSNGVTLGRIISSPLVRARETAEALAAQNPIAPAVTVDDRLIELDYGDWDQIPIRDIRPAQWRAWQADVDFAPPGGESLAELHERVVAALDELVDEARERDIAIVTHVSPIKSIVAWALGVGVEVSWRMFVTNAAISTVSTANGRPQLHRFNDTAHLTDTTGQPPDPRRL